MDNKFRYYRRPSFILSIKTHPPGASVETLKNDYNKLRHYHRSNSIHDKSSISRLNPRKRQYPKDYTLLANNTPFS